MLSAGNISCISRRSHIGLLLIHKAVQRSGAVVYRGGVFEIIIPLTMVSMTMIGPETSPVDNGQVGKLSGQADAPAVMIKLDAQRLTELLTYCQEPKTRTEMQAFCGISSREYFTNNILNPLLETGRLLRTIPDKPKSPNQKNYWNK